MSFGNIITLSNGVKLPQIGLGTWLSEPKEVECAIRNGYRHLDLAMVYRNQDEVGAALKKVIPSVVKREDLFITSKFWNTSHRPEDVEKELDETLSQLGIEYLDLYLIHWPIAFTPGHGLFPLHPLYKDKIEIDTKPTLVDTWRAMINLPKSKVRAIGVSNFKVGDIQAIIDATGVTPVVNQIEAHPLLPQDDLMAYTREKNIHITAYSPLGSNPGKPKLTDHPVVKGVADKLGVTTAQVLITWGVRRGYSVIPKSVHEDRIISNFEQIKLSQEDYEKISSIGHNNHTRFNIPYTFYPVMPMWDVNLFDEPEEKMATFKVNVK